MVHFVSADL